MVVVDLNMPRMGGMEMMRNVRAGIENETLREYKDTKFILSTAQGEQQSSD